MSKDRFDDGTPVPMIRKWRGKDIEEMTRDELLTAFKEAVEAYRQATVGGYEDMVRLADNLPWKSSPGLWELEDRRRRRDCFWVLVWAAVATAAWAFR